MRLLAAGAALAASLALVGSGCGGGALGTVPNGGTRAALSAPAHRVRVPLRPENATALGGVAVLTRARDGQKTRVTVALAHPPRHDVTVEIAVGSCRRPLSLQPHTVLGTMRRAAASWRFPARLASLLSAPAVVVVRAPGSAGGPIASCGPIDG